MLVVREMKGEWVPGARGTGHIVMRIPDQKGCPMPPRSITFGESWGGELR